MKTYTVAFLCCLLSASLHSEPYDAVSKCIDTEQAKPGYNWTEAWNKCKDTTDKTVQLTNPYDKIDVSSLPDTKEPEPTRRGALHQALVYGTVAGIISAIIGFFALKPWRLIRKIRPADIVRRADTKQKRLFLAATPVVHVVALWLLIRDSDWFNYFDEIRFVTTVFVTASVALPVAALTRILNWIDGDENRPKGAVDRGN